MMAFGWPSSSCSPCSSCSISVTLLDLPATLTDAIILVLAVIVIGAIAIAAADGSLHYVHWSVQKYLHQVRIQLVMPRQHQFRTGALCLFGGWLKVRYWMKAW